MAGAGVRTLVVAGNTPKQFFQKGCYKYIRKTVLVDSNNDVNTAYKALDKILRTDGVFRSMRLQDTYEKPTEMRRRVMHERVVRIYDAEMQRKVEFIMRKNRVDPWPI